MTIDYECLSCGLSFPIDVTDAELGSSLAAGRSEACPGCARRVGTGPARCRTCGAVFVVDFPHWHVLCDLAVADCPGCGARYVSPCIC